ncbi:hypothetical protein Phum_PHUM018550 [Pediculus humanus corporis]|uniref:Uncharacterized protein n=1 Tax=Pediculus humanus subsp. corporis TaxID=121224 RepID=E0V9N8_PEDHC|nr:uncharacterized protein Phum_PHUM018550 [Pediculus humanus corporis]EEB10107.1 hypothetical protein Phum_PHUM018550 [Pediculus humanus corporis]
MFLSSGKNMAWTPIGDLMATGSNDKTVKLMKFNPESSNFEGQEIELSMHARTVRDLCFLEDTNFYTILVMQFAIRENTTNCITEKSKADEKKSEKISEKLVPSISKT